MRCQDAQPGLLYEFRLAFNDRVTIIAKVLHDTLVLLLDLNFKAHRSLPNCLLISVHSLSVSSNIFRSLRIPTSMRAI